MGKLNLSERLIDPKSPDRRPRRAAYALPSMFTAGNLLLGFVAIMESIRAALLFSQNQATAAEYHFDLAAIMIGVSVFLDGLDGRIARMTNTVSEFGREFDSLADVISFGVAPGVLAFTWGFLFVDWTPMQALNLHNHMQRAGYFFPFLFLLCGAARLARFNVTANPMPSNPGLPNRKYFVGLPIPASAGMLASVSYAMGSRPLHEWWEAALWMLLIGLLSFLMVSTWRYRSFKDFNLLSPRSFKSVIMTGSLIYLIWGWSQVVLLGMGICYVGSGILIRAGGLLRRNMPKESPVAKESSIG